MVRTAHLISFLVVFGVSFGLSLGLTPHLRDFGARHGFISRRGGRRRTQEMPRTGGIAIFIAFTAAIVLAQFLPVERTDPKEIIRFAGLLLGSSFIILVGTIDDRYELPPLFLYIGQLIAGAIAILFLIFIETFNNPFTGNTTDPFPYVITVTLTLFWMGLMMNTVNFLDGSDGLAGGVTCIAALMIFIHAGFQLNQVSVSLLALALVGATLGFLRYNFYPASVFMGGGSYFLGYALGVLSIIGGAKMATILLVMGLPLTDLAWQMGSRILRGQNPMQGDRGHLHFRLVDAGLSPVWIAYGYYAFCALFGIIALVTASQLFKLLAMGIMLVTVIMVFIMISVVNSSSKEVTHGR